MQTILYNEAYGRLLIHQFIELGKIAKQVQKDSFLLNNIYLEMGELCHKIRPIEIEFKVAYPQYNELYNLLLTLYYKKNYE